MFKKILRNNILLIPQENTGYTTVSFFIAAGSKYEKPESKGLAHLTEHLIVSSSDFHSEIYAETQLEQMVIQSTQHAEATSDVLVKMFNFLFQNDLDSQHFEIQKQRILIELQTQYSHEEHAWIYRRLFGNNSEQHKGWSGDAESIKKLSFNDLCQFKHDFIRPERTVCVIAGDFDVQVIKTTLSGLNLEHVLFKNEALPQLNADKQILLSIQDSDLFSNVEFFVNLSPLQDLRGRMLNRVFRNYLFGNDGHVTNLLYKQNPATYNIDDNSLYWTNGGLLSVAFQIDTEFLELLKTELSKIFSSPRTHITEENFKYAIEEASLHYKKLFSDMDKTSWWYGEDLLLVGRIFSEEFVTSTLNSFTLEEFISHIETLGAMQIEVSS